ncbi:type II toxin-antitoxin system RelE/ParE family toxin [Candidatus Uhrbacteria bacterium]|nr:type II toxin-antitoxin system RelE/ParE family toxin [Candidatus Uhrbacteria bacterium]
MIYTENDEYKVKFFVDPVNGENPVLVYLESATLKDRAKILKYIEFLRTHNGVLDEPYTKHIRGKIRELRVDFSSNRHRIFFFTFINKNIILLHAFLKKTAKTPDTEINKAEANYLKVLKDKKTYA